MLGGAAGNPPITYQKSASLFQPWIRHRNQLVPATFFTFSRIFFTFSAIFQYVIIQFSHHLYHYPAIVKQLAIFPTFYVNVHSFSHHLYHYLVILNHFPPDLYRIVHSFSSFVPLSHHIKPVSRHFMRLTTVCSSFMSLSCHTNQFLAHIQPFLPPCYRILHSFLIICTIITPYSTSFLTSYVIVHSLLTIWYTIILSCKTSFPAFPTILLSF